MQNLQIIQSGLEKPIQRNSLAINWQKQNKFNKKKDKKIKQANCKILAKTNCMQ